MASDDSNDYEVLIGLSYPQICHEGVKSLFDTMIEQEILAQKLFSVYLSQNLKEKSEITFGGINHDRFTGEIDWHPIVLKTLYFIKLDDILVNGKSIGYCNKPNANCIVAPDTGTSAFIWPQGAIDAIEKIDAA